MTTKPAQSSTQKTSLAARLRERKVATLIGVVALVAAIAVGVTVLLVDESPTADGPATILNETGGYSLVAPQGWEVAEQDRTTTVTSPNGDAVLTAGRGEVGPLEDAAAVFFQKVARNYTDFSPIGVQGQRIGSRPALVWAGKGTNANDVGVRFLAITIEDRPRNYAITYFTADGSETRTLLPQVNSVVDSFRPLP
ncbi:MAG: hypothetical protein ACR2FQ_11310 [Pseudonocardiaceae bacterium]